MDQSETKLITFQGSKPGHWCTDIYVDGVRVYCGRGRKSKYVSYILAILWLCDHWRQEHVENVQPPRPNELTPPSA